MCIFLLSNFIASHDFSPNALKNIVCENQAGSWEQDENAKNVRGVWFSYQFGTFWASSSRTGFCKNLLLALVFSLFLDSRETTFFIIFGLKIVSGASVASGHPLHMLCFIYSGEPCPPRPIFLHFFTFFCFFHRIAGIAPPSKFCFSLPDSH